MIQYKPLDKVPLKVLRAKINFNSKVYLYILLVLIILYIEMFR